MQIIIFLILIIISNSHYSSLNGFDCNVKSKSLGFDCNTKPKSLGFGSGSKIVA
jgi:hypothetical protein